MAIDFCTIDKIARKDDEFVIITSLLTLPYCIILTILSLFSAFFFMDRFQRWEKGNK